MSDSKHTPTPWTLDKLPTRICVKGRPGFSGDYRVADAYQSDQLANTPRHDEAKANAAFILKAVNCHEELVAAAKAYRDLILSDYEKNDGSVGGGMAEHFAAVNALLAKAEGQDRST